MECQIYVNNIFTWEFRVVQEYAETFQSTIDYGDSSHDVFHSQVCSQIVVLVKGGHYLDYVLLIVRL